MNDVSKGGNPLNNFYKITTWFSYCIVIRGHFLKNLSDSAVSRGHQNSTHRSLSLFSG